MPRTVRRRNRSWLRVCCSVKSYTPERPSPKSRVAIVVVVGCGSSSSVQPVRLSGLTNGAVNRLARTETGPRPAPSRPRISDTAWYCWVEETCTWVGVPMAPLATSGGPGGVRGHHQILLGHLDQPGCADRRPERAQAVEVGGGRGLGQHRHPPVDGLGDEAGRHRPRRCGEHEVGAYLAQAGVQGREGRAPPAGAGSAPPPSAADRAQFAGHVEEHPRPPTAADQRERGHGGTLTRGRSPRPRAGRRTHRRRRRRLTASELSPGVGPGDRAVRSEVPPAAGFFGTTRCRPVRPPPPPRRPYRVVEHEVQLGGDAPEVAGMLHLVADMGGEGQHAAAAEHPGQSGESKADLSSSFRAVRAKQLPSAGRPRWLELHGRADHTGRRRRKRMNIKDVLQRDPSTHPLVNQGQARIADRDDDRSRHDSRPSCLPSSAKGSMPTGCSGSSRRS